MFPFFDIIVCCCNQTSGEEKKVTMMLPKYRDLTLGAFIKRAEQDGSRIKREDGPEKSGEGGQLSVLATIVAALKKPVFCRTISFEMLQSESRLNRFSD